MKLEITGPETVFSDDASRLLARITELEKHGAPKKSIRKAREHVNKALAHMDEAYSALR